MSQNVDEELSFKVGEEQSGQRLDKALSGYCPDISRARLQSLIKGGQVSVNGIAETKASEKIDQGDRLRVIIPPAQEASPQAQNIKLEVVYEDDDMLVINKPVVSWCIRGRAIMTVRWSMLCCIIAGIAYRALAE